MLAEIRDKIRALIADMSHAQSEFFDYTTSPIFTLSCENASSINTVLINGNPLASGETYDFDETTKKVTLTADLNSGDIIEINYNYTKYSEAELTEYIKASLVWISIFSECHDDFEIEEIEIYPTPTNKDEDLIALIASILIKPDYNSYKLPNLTVSYPRTMTKEQRIELLISRYNVGIGQMTVLELD